MNCGPPARSSRCPAHRVAIWTLGAGEPSKQGRNEYIRVDNTAVLAFASACKAAGVEDFHLLSSVGADARSPSWYLRVKGELEQGLESLGFRRLGIFHPSMILTPTNRYGLLQGILLKVWPLLTPLLAGPLRKYRGVKVGVLGRAIARHALAAGSAGVQRLYWDDYARISRTTRAGY
ncbi:MAG: hypothetical protein FJW31_15160 [Acidobacteria bacterium]|nr:hypothetical protein [Acidobacteriota bacterium]